MPIFGQELPRGTKVELYSLEEALNLGVLVDKALRFSTHDFVHYFYWNEEYKNIICQRHIDGFLGRVVTVDSGEFKPPHLKADPYTHYYRFRNEEGDSALMFVCLVKNVLDVPVSQEAI